jgi:hypothetical protein
LERYVFSPDNTRYNYVATFTDPTAFTRPFTVTIPARRWTLEDRTKPEFAGAAFWHYNHVFPANNPGKPPSAIISSASASKTMVVSGRWQYRGTTDLRTERRPHLAVARDRKRPRSIG